MARVERMRCAGDIKRQKRIIFAVHFYSLFCFRSGVCDDLKSIGYVFKNHWPCFGMYVFFHDNKYIIAKWRCPQVNFILIRVENFCFCPSAYLSSQTSVQKFNPVFGTRAGFQPFCAQSRTLFEPMFDLRDRDRHRSRLIRHKQIKN